MKFLCRAILPLLVAACTPDRWASMQSEWEEPEPDAARAAVEVPAGLEPEAERPSPFEPPADGGPLRLSIEQATLLALGHNRDLAVQQLAPVRAGAFELIERGRFDPELYASLEYGEETTIEVSRSIEDQFEVEGSDRTFGTGIRQELPTGTTVDVGFDQDRDISNRTPEQETARIGLTVTQSLLRGLGPAVNLARVRQAELGKTASVYELRGYAQALLADTEIEYWNFVLSRRQIEIVEESLAVAQRQLDEVRQRIEVGLLPDTELAVARAEVALREQALINARAELEERRLRLLRLMSPEIENAFDRGIEPTSAARVDAKPIENLPERLELALASRPDLQEARLRQEQDRLEVVVTRNGLLPRLDLFITLGKSGYADTFLGSLEDLDGDGYDVRVGLSLNQYLNRRTARGRDLLERASWRQSAEAVRNLEQIVDLDVRLAANELERSRQRIGATATTRALQEETVAAERQKYEVGTSTALLVAQAQRDLLLVQIQEVEAVIDYRIALVRLYLAEGTLLERRGVRLDGFVE